MVIITDRNNRNHKHLQLVISTRDLSVIHSYDVSRI